MYMVFNKWLAIDIAVKNKSIRFAKDNEGGD